MADSVKDLVVRLAFEHGDTRQQISAITNELKLLDSGFAASAAMAAGFSGGLNQTGGAADQLRQKLSVQQQLVEKYGQAIEQANQKLQKSIQAHQQQGQRIEDLKTKHADLIAEKTKLAAAMEAEAKANGDNSMAYLEMGAKMDALNATIQKTESAISKEEAAFARSDKAISRNEQAIQKLTTEQNRAKAAMAQTEAALQLEESRLQRNAMAWESAAEAADRFAKSAKGAGEWQTKAGKTLTKASAGIVGLGVAAGKAAIDWESQFAGVRKTVNGTEEDLQRIHDALLDMQVPTDYGDLAEIAANAGQLGIATANVVDFTRTMADLAETTDLTAEAAASGFAQYANITQMPQENIGRLGSVTVELGNNLATTESKIVDFAQAIGAAGSQAGMTDQQIFGISGGLASLGLEAQAGGTAFSTPGGTLSGVRISAGSISGSISGRQLAWGAVGAGQLASDSIDTRHLQADSVNADALQANSVTAGKVAAGAITAEKLDAGAVTAEKLAAGAVTAAKIDAESVSAAVVETDAFEAATADIAQAEIGSADIGFAQIKDANVEQLIAQDAVTGRYYIRKLQVDNAQMVQATVGALVIKAGDGKYYRLDFDSSGNLSPTEVTLTQGEITAGETADGRGSIIETDLTVQDLAATNLKGINALIDKITTKRLYATQAFIDELNTSVIQSQDFIQLVVGTVDDTVEDAMQDATPAVLRIDSSRGTVFKDNQVSTVLSITIHYGSVMITTPAQLQAAFGNGAYLQWEWLRIDDERSGVISASDSRLSNGGFQLTLGPDDVDVKVTFWCKLMV